MTPRKYDQRLRAESAEDTRRRILDAVTERLRAAPREPLSLDQVARLAKVARSTIYLVFGSRAGLFDAFAKDLAQRTGLAELTRAVGSTDAREHLRRSAIAACRMLAADRDIYRVLFAMARFDPEMVGGAVATMEENRRGGMEYLANRLAEDGVLRPDVTVEQATDLLWMLTSFEAFDLLYTDRGLTAEQVADQLATTVERTLCQ